MRRGRFLPLGLGARLFASHFLVAMVAALTLLVTIFLAAPLIFGELMGGMMDRMGGMSEMMDSVSRAFVRTLLYSLLVSGLVAAVAAVAASLLVSRRIVGPVRRVLGAIRRVSAGSHGERVPAEGRDEVGELAEGFNTMAKALEDAERRRMDLIGDVSHELRTPLSNLRGYMEGLMEGAVEPSEETWALLYGEAGRMEHLVDDLGRLSRAEAGRLDLRMAPVLPAEAVRIAAGRTLPLFEEKSVRLEDQLSGDSPPVRADADRVVQVLTNLLSNALHHTPAGGRVSVGVEARDKEVVFSVEDTGEGVAEEHLPHLFERFYRVEKSRSRGEARGGSGVGLAISKALVEAMGGRIRADSEGPGKGATFSFSLPTANPRS